MIWTGAINHILSVLGPRHVSTADSWSWSEVPEAKDDPTEWTVLEYAQIPAWVWNALVRREVVPAHEPKVGDKNWGGPLKVRATGKIFPLGSVITRSDLQA